MVVRRVNRSRKVPKRLPPPPLPPMSAPGSFPERVDLFAPSPSATPAPMKRTESPNFDTSGTDEWGEEDEGESASLGSTIRSSIAARTRLMVPVFIPRKPLVEEWCIPLSSKLLDALSVPTEEDGDNKGVEANERDGLFF